MNVARLTMAMVGQPYELGRMDCFGVVVAWLRLRGVDLPCWEGWAPEDYGAIYAADPETAKCLAPAYLDSFLTSVAPGFAFAGDVLALSLPGEAVPFLAVHGGNGQALTCTPERGVCLLPLDGYEIRRSWRCPRP